MLEVLPVIGLLFMIMFFFSVIFMELFSGRFSGPEHPVAEVRQ